MPAVNVQRCYLLQAALCTQRWERGLAAAWRAKHAALGGTPVPGGTFLAAGRAAAAFAVLQSAGYVVAEDYQGATVSELVTAVADGVTYHLLPDGSRVSFSDAGVVLATINAILPPTP